MIVTDYHENRIAEALNDLPIYLFDRDRTKFGLQRDA